VSSCSLILCVSVDETERKCGNDPERDLCDGDFKPFRRQYVTCRNCIAYMPTASPVNKLTKLVLLAVVLLYMLSSALLGLLFSTDSLPVRQGKARNSIYIALFIYCVYLKALRRGSHSFTCKYAMPARQKRQQCRSNRQQSCQYNSYSTTSGYDCWNR